MELDAIVLVDPATADVRIAGIAARERAVRVAKRAGATRVHVDQVRGARPAIASWRGDRTNPVLVIRADQLVHSPLVAPLLAADGELAIASPGLAGARSTAPRCGVSIAVGPDDAYAGALLASGAAAGRAIEALVRGDSDAAIAETADARVPHGEIARHPIGTPAERRAAHAHLYRILVKPQDNVITRYLFRPLSSRLSRLLVRTPVTATQVSIVVALLVAYGCYLTLDPRPSMLIAGALTILGASYLDCCDGEIARVKLQSSTFGAWLDTIVDELSSIGYMVCLGWHCHAYYGSSYLGDLGFDPWLVGICVGLVTYLWSLFCIYYNIIVGVGSANSQDYASRFVVVPGSRADTVKLAPRPPAAAREWPRWLAPIIEFLPNIVRRDFIVWLAAFYAVLDIAHISFATHILGGVVSSIVCTIDHVHLRRMRASVRRAGQLLEPAKR